MGGVQYFFCFSCVGIVTDIAADLCDFPSRCGQDVLRSDVSAALHSSMAQISDIHVRVLGGQTPPWLVNGASDGNSISWLLLAPPPHRGFSTIILIISSSLLGVR